MDYETPVWMLRPDTHNALRAEVGLDPVEHCADCWGVIDGGVCRDCGGTDVYESKEAGE